MVWWRAKLSLVAAGSDEMIRRVSGGSGGGMSTCVMCFTSVVLGSKGPKGATCTSVCYLYVWQQPFGTEGLT